MTIVGLTGGIASGKSLVSDELKRLGALIVDADVISREVMRPGTPAYIDIKEAFGPEVIKIDGEIDRKKLGSMVFSDPAKLKRLNAITHPRIRERIKERVAEIERCRDPLIVIDAALLIEGGLYKEMSKVIVVYADEEKQTERLVRREHLSPEEAKTRIHSQMPLKEKLEYADYVIDNNGPMEDAVQSVRELYRKLTSA